MKTSCVLSCYKKESPRYLEEALKSILNQTIQADEVIIVEDGFLTEDLYKVLDYFDSRLPLKRIKLKANVGLAKALNIALKECSNEIIFRMDTDDICKPNRFEEQLAIFKKNKGVDIVGSWANDIDDKGTVLRMRKVPSNDADIKRLIWTCPIIHPAVAYKKSKIQKLGCYDEKLRKRQDHDLWFRAAKGNLEFYNIPKVLLDYRFTDNFFKKNNTKVAFSHAMLGVKGLISLRSFSIVAYIGVFIPLVRSLLPNSLSKKFQQLMNKFDPRKK